jgi:hypothetical protein
MSSHPNEPTSTYRKILGLAIPVGLETVFQTSLGAGRFRTPAWYRKSVDGLSQSPSDQKYHRIQFK